MQQINEIIANGAISILVILAGIAVKSIKDFLIKKVEKRLLRLLKSLLKCGQCSGSRSLLKLDIKAKRSSNKHELKSVLELAKYNISMTDKDLDTFVESAVKQMNDAWKGK